MLRQADVVVHLRRRPFVPLRLHISDGTTFEIRHPDQAVVGPTTLDLGMAVSINPFAIAEHRVTIDLLHIAWLESVVSPPPATSN